MAATIANVAMKTRMRANFAPAKCNAAGMKGWKRRTMHVCGVAAPPRQTQMGTSDEFEDVLRSGLDGVALVQDKTFPSQAEVLRSIPKHCMEKNTAKSMAYAATSVALTLGCLAVGHLIPLKLAFLPVWMLYAAVTGTVATGCWVIAHECGHGAFSDNAFLQDAVGFVLHSALLVPYFSWQRSHAIHHARTNHMTEGETHVPHVAGTKAGDGSKERKEKMGEPIYTVVRLFTHLVFGWPAYILFGATGGPKYGTTNHFWPYAPFSGKLFPGKWKQKVLFSAAGVFAMVGVLTWWAKTAGVLAVAALYGGPLLVANFWLVLYTWLQHTDVDIPHFDKDNWTFIKGAFHTVDRPYGPVLDFLHHRIGSTHVAHHVNSTIPHYNAVEATNALKEKYPEHYLFDPTPIHKAMWRVASKCIAVEKRGNMYVFK